MNTSELARLIGVEQCTVSSWRASRLIEPVGRDGAAVVYSWDGILRAAAIARLRAAHVSMPRVRRALAALDRIEGGLMRYALIAHTGEVVAVDLEGVKLPAALRAFTLPGGQGVLVFVFKDELRALKERVRSAPARTAART